METDAKHEEDDAQLRQLVDCTRISYEARRKGTDDDPRQHVANDGGQPNATRNQPTRKGHDQCDGDIDEKRYVVHELFQIAGRDRSLSMAPTPPGGTQRPDMPS